MFKVSSKNYSVLSILCAALALCLLVFQFLPYWQVGEGEEAQGVSIQEFLWFPEQHAGGAKSKTKLQKTFDAQYDELKAANTDVIEAKAAAIVAEMGLPEDEAAKELKKQIKEVTANEYTYNINNVTKLPIALFFLLVASVVLCSIFMKNVLPSVLPLGAGIVGVLNYYTNFIFTMVPMCNVHLGISAALAVAGFVTVVLGVLEVVKNKQAAAQ